MPPKLLSAAIRAARLCCSVGRSRPRGIVLSLNPQPNYHSPALLPPGPLQISPQWNGFSWLMDVHMKSGQLLHAYVWSLGAFWPGLQV
jgi:hypothetical protein